MTHDAIALVHPFIARNLLVKALYVNFIPDHDVTVVTRLCQAGAVLLALQLNCFMFAAISYWDIFTYIPVQCLSGFDTTSV